MSKQIASTLRDMVRGVGGQMTLEDADVDLPIPDSESQARYLIVHGAPVRETTMRKSRDQTKHKESKVSE